MFPRRQKYVPGSHRPHAAEPNPARPFHHADARTAPLRDLEQTAAITAALCNLAEASRLDFIGQLLRLAQRESGSDSVAVQTVESEIGFSH